MKEGTEMFNMFAILILMSSFCYSNSFHVGPVCNQTNLLIDSTKSLNSYKVQFTTYEMGMGNLKYSPKDSLNIKWVKPSTDTSHVKSDLFVEGNSNLQLVRIDSLWKSRGLIIESKGKDIGLIFLSDSLPSFCHIQSEKEIKERANLNSTVFLSILFIPVVIVGLFIFL